MSRDSIIDMSTVDEKRYRFLTHAYSILAKDPKYDLSDKDTLIVKEAQLELLKLEKIIANKRADERISYAEYIVEYYKEEIGYDTITSNNTPNV